MPMSKPVDFIISATLVLGSIFERLCSRYGSYVSYVVRSSKMALYTTVLSRKTHPLLTYVHVSYLPPRHRTFCRRRPNHHSNRLTSPNRGYHLSSLFCLLTHLPTWFSSEIVSNVTLGFVSTGSLLIHRAYVHFVQPQQKKPWSHNYFCSHNTRGRSSRAVVVYGLIQAIPFWRMFAKCVTTMFV